MSKGFRQAQIQKLIRTAAIHTQEELASALGQLEVEATQVTLSRDIRELGIIKTADGYQERADLAAGNDRGRDKTRGAGRDAGTSAGNSAGRDADKPAAKRARDNLSRVLKQFLRDAQVAQNLVVLKTNPGGAGAVALALDSEHWPEIVGTVAGDDTIFAATPSPAKARKLRQKLVDLG
jgi:transcriptional regulator of arginine metabolism